VRGRLLVAEARRTRQLREQQLAEGRILGPRVDPALDCGSDRHIRTIGTPEACREAGMR